MVRTRVSQCFPPFAFVLSFFVLLFFCTQADLHTDIAPHSHPSICHLPIPKHAFSILLPSLLLPPCILPCRPSVSSSVAFQSYPRSSFCNRYSITLDGTQHNTPLLLCFFFFYTFSYLHFCPSFGSFSCIGTFFYTAPIHALTQTRVEEGTKIAGRRRKKIGGRKQKTEKGAEKKKRGGTG